jgi:predicted TIM-barrel fold metal-dependent hydrolase
LPSSLRDRAPHLEARNGEMRLVMEGMPPRRMGGAPKDDDGSESQRAPGGSDASARLRDLEVDGVSAEVIYPTLGLFLYMVPDPALQLACARAYNDWCVELFFDRRDVFIPSAIIPVLDPNDAVAEFERCVALGFRSATLPTHPPDDARWNSDVHDPLWRAAASAGVPLSFHVGTGTSPTTERGPGGAVINYVYVGIGAQQAVAYFVAGGVLAKHPNLHVVMVESGAGWLGWLVERMDEAYTEHENWVTPKLDALPSDYVRRQVHVTLGADRAPINNREITGVEPLMWASDYPHPEGTWPESQTVVERIFKGVPDHEVDAIAGLNAKALYKL